MTTTGTSNVKLDELRRLIEGVRGLEGGAEYADGFDRFIESIFEQSPVFDTEAPRKSAHEVFIGLAPVPASRPRVTRFGTYYSKTYKNWKDQAQGFFPKLFKVAEGSLRVELEVVCKRPQKPAGSVPTGDIDNYAKAALDAVNDAGLWGDDKQVVCLHAIKRYAAPGEDPGTHIRIYTYLHGD